MVRHRTRKYKGHLIKPIFEILPGADLKETKDGGMKVVKRPKRTFAYYQAYYPNGEEYVRTFTVGEARKDIDSLLNSLEQHNLLDYYWEHN